MTSSLTRTGAGRPRRLDDEQERQLLIDAGIAVMQRNGYENASVDGILVEAGLSTRAFYRHFASKDALLLAIFRRDADRVAARFEQVVSSAADGLTAISAWLEEFFALFRHQRKAARVAAMSAPAARRAVGYEEERERAEEVHSRWLAAAIARAVREGAATSDDAEADAHTIYAIAMSTIRRPDRRLSAKESERARRRVERFVWPALGIEPAKSTRRSPAS